MAPQQPRYSAEETARRGDEIYEREVSARVEAGNHGKVVAVDIETSAYALDESALASAKRLRARCPNTEVWFVRVGHRALHRIGLRSSRPVTGRAKGSSVRGPTLSMPGTCEPASSWSRVTDP